MSDFVYDDLPVPNGKSDFDLLPAIPSNQKVVSAEWNLVMLYLLNIQAWARGAKWIGLAQQTADPAPAGVGRYIYEKTDGKLYKEGDVPIADTGNRQEFIHAVTGSEAGYGTNLITIPLPATRASTTYGAQASGAGLSSLVIFDCPQSGYTTNSVQVATSSPLSIGDKVLLVVADLTS